MTGFIGTAAFGHKYTYTARPSALKLRYSMEALGKVDFDGEKLEKDEQDIATVFVCIVDWKDRHNVLSGMDFTGQQEIPSGMWNPSTKEGLSQDEKIIAYGLYDITATTEDFVDLTIPLNFYDKDAVAPTGNYTLVISCSCSKYGDYLNGCSSNVMYVDDFQWVY